MKQVLIVATMFFFGMAPSLTHAACSGPAGDKASMMYNDDYGVMQFCNGTDWIAMSGISPAAGGGADWYQTSTTHQGDTADTACDSGYHMCFYSEWWGNPYNTSKNANPEFLSNSWAEGSASENCSNWTSAAGGNDGLQTYVSADAGWDKALSSSCGVARSVLCCSD